MLRGVESVRSQAEVGKGSHGSTGTGRMIDTTQSKFMISLNLISRAKTGVSVIVNFKQVQ